ncbi:MAG: hypothetical protein LBV27_07920 [Oscillospiraceae bacterium]|jgi:uncharacterized protein YdeI (YjbR/CyaY-like superfamily)|nr:hypothetical protein [Oscillospiraceae bacterium]
MISNNTFIGTGRNPDGPDLPLGFGMLLAQDADAMNAYGQLSNSEKASVISYIQSSTTGADAKNRIAQSVNNLKSGTISFS